jgi:hypothetical protein
MDAIDLHAIFLSGILLRYLATSYFLVEENLSKTISSKI